MAFSRRVSESKRPLLGLFLAQFFLCQAGAACFLWAGFGGPGVQHWRYATAGVLLGSLSVLGVLNYVWPRSQGRGQRTRPPTIIDDVSRHARGADSGA